MRLPRTPSVLALALFCTTVAAIPLTGAVQGTVRKVYVTVTDKDGNPVIDMKAADFEVKEGGKTQEINTKIADAPIRMAVILSDRGSGAFQLATLRLLEPLVGKGEFSITTLNPQPENVMAYTGNPREIEAGLEKIGRRGNPQLGAQVVDTIYDVATKIKKEGSRPVIVVMRGGGEGPTSTRAERVRDEIRKAGAILYTLSTTGTQGMQRSTQATGAVTASSAERAMSNDEQNEGLMILGTVLGEGAKDSGGRHDQNVATTLVPTAQRIAKELLNQYEISYTLPSGTKPSDRIQVTSKRKNVELAAPTRIAN